MAIRISFMVCVAALAMWAGRAIGAEQGSVAGVRIGVGNDASVIDVKRLKAVKPITVGRFPWGVVVK